MIPDDMDAELIAEVNAKSHELMKEFEQHFQQIIEIKPSAKERRDQVFQGWAIQKIAGLQLSVEKIAVKFNEHLGGADHLN